MFRLEISAATGKAFVPYLRRNLILARRMVKARLGEMSLALVGNQRMAQLHLNYMKIDGPTDVLTFELDHDSRNRVTAGEVVVCVPFAMRASKKAGTAVRDELLLYALHGMLHLCGFDDRNFADFERMHQREDSILKRLGVGAVFYGENNCRRDERQKDKGRQECLPHRIIKGGRR